MEGEFPPSVWRAMPPSVLRTVASRLSELVTVVELVMMTEFGTNELGQGRRGSPNFSTPLKLTSTFPISIEFNRLILEGYLLLYRGHATLPVGLLGHRYL